jgi:glycosyltransferase involved in cell wall biosynthesis
LFPIRILTFSSLYPDVTRPQFGIFVETRLRHLVASGKIAARVIAPCPWFPSANPCFGKYAEFARVPCHEERYGITIDHPRYLQVPKVGMSAAPLSMALTLLPLIRRQIRLGRDFDVIDAHYMHPDGVAAALLGGYLRRPVTITCRGTDLNTVPQYRMARRQIIWAANRAAGLITVSEGLRRRLTALGIPSDRVAVLRNGVDVGRFRPSDRMATRGRLGLSGPVLLSVGNLVALKGHELIIKSLTELPEATLLIIGEGPMRQSLEDLVRSVGAGRRVQFLGRRQQEELPGFYSAADALVLASSQEGWPNVLLESMACGTPVIASNIPGPDEIVRDQEAGALLAERTPAAIARAVRDLLARQPDRDATRAYAQKFSWDATTAGQIALFAQIVMQQGTRAGSAQFARTMGRFAEQGTSVPGSTVNLQDP